MLIKKFKVILVLNISGFSKYNLAISKPTPNSSSIPGNCVDFIKTKEMQSSDQEGNTEFLKQKRNFHIFEPCSILDIKHFLSNQNVSCRL